MAIQRLRSTAQMKALLLGAGSMAGAAAAAVSPSGVTAVIDGAIMLARTVVALAETPAQRDRVMELRERRMAR